MNETTDRETSPGAIEEAAQDWFLRLASGAATAADLADFKAWREADPRHAVAYEEVRDLWNDIDALRPAFTPCDEVEAPADPHRRRERRGGGAHPRKTAVFGPRRVAAGGLLAACLAVLALFLGDIAVLLRADHSTGIGEQAEVRLPDGTLAHLNSDTAIALAYAGDRRQVSLLRGEALFEVAKDPARTFAVRAREGLATAVGTVFAVRDLAGTATVTVIEGRVRVQAPAGSDGALPPRDSGKLLLADQQIAYRDGAPPGTVAAVDAARATAWREGSIVIEGLPLERAIAEIERYRPGKILLLADTAQFDRVTARLSLQAIDSGLEALAATYGLTVTRVTDYLVILR